MNHNIDPCILFAAGAVLGSFVGLFAAAIIRGDSYCIGYGHGRDDMTKELAQRQADIKRGLRSPV